MSGGSARADSSWTPVRRGALSDDGESVRDPQGSVIVLNTTAQAVWELCDGSTTMPEMVHALLTLFDAPEATIRHDVSEALIELSRHGLLSQPQEEPA